MISYRGKKGVCPMNWNQNRSVKLSQGCLIAFAALLTAADIGGYWLTQWALSIARTLRGPWDGALLMATLYAFCAVEASVEYAKRRSVRRKKCPVSADDELVLLWGLPGLLCQQLVLAAYHAGGHCSRFCRPYCPHRKKCFRAGNHDEG